MLLSHLSPTPSKKPTEQFLALLSGCVFKIELKHSLDRILNATRAALRRLD